MVKPARHLLQTILDVTRDLVSLASSAMRPRAQLAAENLFLRKQLALHQERKVKPRRADGGTRMILAGLSRFLGWRQLLVIVTPETLIRWHRKGFRLFWRWKSRAPGPHDYFFDDLDQEVESSTLKALVVIQMITAGLTDVTLPYRASDLESARGVVRAAEAYVYHTEWVTKTPELYQPETLLRLRTGVDVAAPAYIRARREVAEARRAIEGVFRTVDVLVTPTVPMPPHLLADLAGDVTTSMRRSAINAHNMSPFNVYGIPSMSVPCGLTKNGLPIGLQISGAKEAEQVVFQVAAAYENATGWKARAHLAT